MVIKGYTLEDFIHDMTDKLKQETDPEKILDQGSALLERLVRNPDCIPPEYRTLSSKSKKGHSNYGNYLLYRSPEGLTIQGVVWPPGGYVPPHDHHTWGMVGVLENVLEETRFRRLDDGSRPDYAQLEKDRIVVTKAGEVGLLIPGVDEIHEIYNGGDRPTVEIHVYGQDQAKLKRCTFDLETGKVTPRILGGYDNE